MAGNKRRNAEASFIAKFLLIDTALGNACGAQQALRLGILHCLPDFFESVFAIDEIVKRKALAVGVHEIERFDQIAWVIVVYAGDGEELAQDLVGIDAHERIGI